MGIALNAPENIEMRQRLIKADRKNERWLEWLGRKTAEAYFTVRYRTRNDIHRLFLDDDDKEHPRAFDKVLPWIDSAEVVELVSKRHALEKKHPQAFIFEEYAIKKDGMLAFSIEPDVDDEPTFDVVEDFYLSAERSLGDSDVEQNGSETGEWKHRQENEE